MPFRTRAVVTGAALATAAALLGPAEAYAARNDGERWTAAPAPGGGARPSAQDRPYFYLEGAPGTVLKDRLALTNPTGSAVTIRVGGAPAGPGRWIVTASEEVRVPPRTRADVPFTVTVPGDADPGDHPTALVAEASGRKAAVPVHLRVTGPALAALSVEDVAVERRGSAAVIRYVLVNRGNTTLAPRLAVHADGLFGPALRRAARVLPVTLPPGRRLPLTEPWPDPPALDSVDVRLTVTAAGGARGTAVAAYTAVPWGAAALPPAGLLAGAAVWRLRRRRRVGDSRAGAAQKAPCQAEATRASAPQVGASQASAFQVGTSRASAPQAGPCRAEADA
ncbi:hypothetical protein CP973_05440 [Streptomyces albofaciens JCM 4342]|uniref:COG1470 family protein n=1 Tax=Streptomyces albofaciens TaxID=66866 RepID=UPI00123BEE6D|nr:hypothetical protein [Streptomyces albofaciens]KAA6221488.1 hypothetical protein CP973_05440 [Streptomyces albofaciens JCM 4342]